MRITSKSIPTWRDVDEVSRLRSAGNCPTRNPNSGYGANQYAVRSLRPLKSSAFHGALLRQLLNRFLVIHLRIVNAEGRLDKFDE